MHPLSDPTQLDQWIAQLQRINAQGALSRRHSNNQRTTTDIHEDAQRMLKGLQTPFRIDFEWQGVNCVLIGCLQSIGEGHAIAPDQIVIPHLQALNQRLLPTREEGEWQRKTIPLHQDAKRLLRILGAYFRAQKLRCRWHWQTFNYALIYCLSGKEHLIGACQAIHPWTIPSDSGIAHIADSDANSLHRLDLTQHYTVIFNPLMVERTTPRNTRSPPGS